MPKKNSIKQYVSDGYYHLYNRGVNKMDIFMDEKDYRVFLSYIKDYLLAKNTKELSQILHNTDSTYQQKEIAIAKLSLKNYYKRIDLIAYCLMPNHFHLLVQQKEENDVAFFMRSLMTRYSQYFNRRYKRVGPIYQGRYQAVLIETDEQLIHLTRYIHRNPIELGKTSVGKNTILSQPSSYSVYLGNIKQDWVKPETVLSNFSKIGVNSYRSFVEDIEEDEKSFFIVSSIALD